MRKNNLIKKGFTLIELLVVISIISILSTIVLGSLGDARDRAAWVAFDSEILEIRNAVQIYRENNNGEWPNGLGGYTGLSTLIGTLNSSGLYSGDLTETPNGIQLYTYTGSKINSGDPMSCGSWKTDVYYTIFSESDDSELSSVMESMYYSGSSYAGSYSCIEFR